MDFLSKLHTIFSQKNGFDPSEEQLELMEGLAEFIDTSVPKSCFVLKGYAGTGKSTVMGSLVMALIRSGRTPVLLAPTGRAAKVLSKMSNRAAFTIHKKIYARKISDGISSFQLLPNLIENSVYIVDEASMIADYQMEQRGNFAGRSLLRDLLEHVFSGRNSRLIFVGDTAQLPPVGSPESPALDTKLLSAKYDLLTQEYELTRVHRQAQESGVLFNATAIRDDIRQNKEGYFRFDPNFQDLEVISGYDLIDYLESSYSSHGVEGTILITRSNKRANDYNMNIRNRVFYYEENIVANDWIMAVKNNYFWTKEEKELGFIANGEMMKVTRILNREHKYGFEFAQAEVCLWDLPGQPEIEVKLLLDSLLVEGPSLPRDKMKELFYAVEMDYMHEHNRNKRVKEVMKDPYFQALQVKFAYAVTCHKSQGGQWPHVYLEQGYVTEEMLDRELKRWFYTAVTRSSEKLYLLNFHSEFILDD